MTGLVWKGKIIKKLLTNCPHGDFLCEFSCHEIEPFRIICCGQLFVDKKGEKPGDDVYIPMKFWQGEGKNRRLYNPATEDTPLSRPSYA